MTMDFLFRLSLIFFLFLFIEIYGEIHQNYWIIWIFKPLLMPILLIIFSSYSPENFSNDRRAIFIALIFSTLGDLFLLHPETNLFVFGLISFLIAHLSYIVAFLIRLKDNNEHLTRTKIIFASIPFLFFLATIFAVFYPKLTAEGEGNEHLLLPVMIYTGIIVTMAFLSFLRGRQSRGYWLVFLGALLFVLSDTILAVNKFLLPIPTASFYVMFSYGLGQYLITIGVL